MNPETEGVVKKRIFRGWFVAAACFLSMLVSAGIGWFTFPVFIPPLKSEFGWTDLQIGGAIGLWAAIGAAFSPMLGRLLDRFGARWIMFSAVAGGGLVCFGMAEIQGITHLYIILVFATLTNAASTYIPVTNLISRWFVRRRGTAMGIAMAGVGLGGFIFPNLTSYFVQSIGWRPAYRVFGLMLWIILLPVIFFWVHSRPSDAGLKPDDDSDADALAHETASAADSLTARQAFTVPQFWFLGLADVAQAIPVMALGLYMVDFSIDAGIGAGVAALAYSSISAAAMVGTIIAGPAADRLNRRVLISLCYGLPAGAVFLLFGLKSAMPLFLFTIFEGLCMGGRNALWPLVVNDCFGSRYYSTVLGFLIIFYSTGNVIGPPLGGAISDATGGFYWVFVLSIACYLMSGILAAVGAKARRRESIAANLEAS